LPKLPERFYSVVVAGARKIRDVIQVTCTNLKQSFVGDPFRDAPMHPGFETNYQL
jgi:hypothetical protein